MKKPANARMVYAYVAKMNENLTVMVLLTTINVARVPMYAVLVTDFDTMDSEL